MPDEFGLSIPEDLDNLETPTPETIHAEYMEIKFLLSTLETKLNVFIESQTAMGRPPIIKEIEYAD